MYLQVIWEGSTEWHKHFRKHENAFQCYFLKTEIQVVKTISPGIDLVFLEYSNFITSRVKLDQKSAIFIRLELQHNFCVVS